MSVTMSRSSCSPVSAVIGIGLVASGSWRSVVVGLVVVRRRQQRRTDVGETAGDPVGDVEQRRRGLAHPIALVGEEDLELFDVGLEEVTSRLERLDLAEYGEALGLACLPGTGTRFVEQLCCHVARRRQGRGRLVVRRREDPVRLPACLGDGRVGGALGEQQCATDRLGLVDRRVDRRAGADFAGATVADFLEAGDRGACAGLHRGRLVLCPLEFVGDIAQEDPHLLGIHTLADGLELGAPDTLRAHVHDILLCC